MYKRIMPVIALLLLCVLPTLAQQPQPLTFWYGYNVQPGKEAEFMNLVRSVGQPVRDKLMAEGVVFAWGVETPLLRHPNGHTHYIWFAVAEMAGVERVLTAMEAQRARLAVEEARAADEARKKNQKPSMTTEERIRDVLDSSKTRDWLTRDLVFAATESVPAAGSTPYTRFAFVKVKPGQGSAYRAAWEKHTKPIYDKLLKGGVILAYGFAVEELRTDGEFTHFTWVATKDLAGTDQVRSAVVGDRMARSQEDRDAIAQLFTSLTEPNDTRHLITKAILFRVQGQK